MQRCSGIELAERSWCLEGRQRGIDSQSVEHCQRRIRQQQQRVGRNTAVEGKRNQISFS